VFVESGCLELISRFNLTLKGLTRLKILTNK